MRRLATKSMNLIAFLIAGFAISRSASADTQAHLNALAVKIDRQASLLLTETVHYRHTPKYHALVAEVATLRAKARHMKVTTFCSRSFHHLEEDLRIVDRCFHQIEDFFDHAELAAARGRGHIHGNTRHVKGLLNAMEDTIHHMQDDVRALRTEIFGLQRGRRHQPDVYSSHRIYSNPGIYSVPDVHSHRNIHGHSRTIYSNGRSSIQLYSGPRNSCPQDRRSGHGSSSGLRINRGDFSFRINF